MTIHVSILLKGIIKGHLKVEKIIQPFFMKKEASKVNVF
jgi:hypothetical protein